MIDLFQVAEDVQTLCIRQGWRFCFIGGLAIQRWGEPRVTKDVDLTLLTGFGGEQPYIDALLQRYAARIGDAANSPWTIACSCSRRQPALASTSPLALCPMKNSWWHAPRRSNSCPSFLS